MTSREELNRLQIDARKSGRVANFIISESGYIGSVAYLDPEGRGREKSGMIIDPLTFAEKERVKKKWWEKPERFSFLRKPRMSFCH